MNGSENGNHRRRRASATGSMPDVKVFLSRPTYPLGGTVVGTILIQQKGPLPLPLPSEPSGEGEDGEDEADLHPLRAILESVTVYVAGFCKIDSRWHDSRDYKKIYGKMHPYLELLQQDELTFDADLLEQSEDTVCIWATNGMEALDLPERTEGRRWGGSDADFQRGLGYDGDEDSKSMGDSGNDDESDDCGAASAIGRNVLAFTFRVDIPSDLPHSVHATTCRYYYMANVLIKTKTQQQILKRGFKVVTGSSGPDDGDEQNKRQIQRARVRFGECVGVAHSNGLPCHLSSTEIHRPRGQLVVEQDHCLVQQYQPNADVRTMRVTNATGRPVCILTVIGSQSLSPGSRVHLQWDFPKVLLSNREVAMRTRRRKKNSLDGNSSDINDYWIPCHQVCACLQGEEYAVFEDDTKTRTQSFLFDACHERVEPGVTDRITKTLWLSSAGTNSEDGNGSDNTSFFEGGTPPCDLKTDVMEVSTWCKVDITIPDQQNRRDRYSNLSLTIPCRVRHHRSAESELEDRDALEQPVAPLHELLFGGEDSLPATAAAFPKADIRSDLKVLSLALEEAVAGGSTSLSASRSGHGGLEQRTEAPIGRIDE